RLGELLQRSLNPDPLARPDAATLAAELQKAWNEFRNRGRRRVFAVLIASALLGIWATWTYTNPSPQVRLSNGLRALTQDRDPQRAIREFSVILDVDQSRVDVRVLRGCAYIETGQFQEAYTDLSMVREVFDSPEIHSLLGYVLLNLDRTFAVAEVEYE